MMPRPGTQVLVVFRASKIVISGLFASSLVRNNISPFSVPMPFSADLMSTCLMHVYRAQALALLIQIPVQQARTGYHAIPTYRSHLERYRGTFLAVFGCNIALLLILPREPVQCGGSTTDLVYISVLAFVSCATWIIRLLIRVASIVCLTWSRWAAPSFF